MVEAVPQRAERGDEAASPVDELSADRFLHLLVTDLLEAHDAPPTAVINGALAALVDYLDLEAAGVIAEDRHEIMAWSGRELDRPAIDRLDRHHPDLLGLPDVTTTINRGGPGESWHVRLSPDQQQLIGTLQSTLTVSQITLPHGEDELAIVAVQRGLDAPDAPELTLLSTAMSHLIQYLRRYEAEQSMLRRGALDEALASAGVALLEAEAGELVDRLRLPVQRIATIMDCVDATIEPGAADDPALHATSDGRGPHRWSLPVSDGTDIIGTLTWSCADDADTAEIQQAWELLLKLVPSAAERLHTEQRLAAAFAHAPVAICQYDANGRIVDCNRAMLRFLGFDSPAELHGWTRRDLIATRQCDPTLLDAFGGDGIPGGAEVPFARRDGRVVWGRVTSSRSDTNVAFVLDHVEDITEVVSERAVLLQQRTIDNVTGLLTRGAAHEQLGSRLADAQPTSALIVDLDRFATINELVGHAAADELLRAVGTRLSAAAPADAVLARLTGDEFLVVTPLVSRAEVTALAADLLAALREPFTLGADEIRVGASIGISIAKPPASAEATMLGAAEALRQAKFGGRNRSVLFSGADSTARPGRFESDLRAAVGDGELDLLFQPEIDLETGRVLGAEALVRWTHPRHGMVDAGVFVPLAEELGICSEITERVLRQACEAAASWRRDFPNESLRVSVNLSQRDVDGPEIVDLVASTLKATGLVPEALCLELTETAVMRDRHRSMVQLDRLKQLGVSLSIDDFGTGYSSLWLLRELPFDTLKIDRAFVQALEHSNAADAAIVETIVQLATTLGMEIVAEGIETEAQRAALRTLGIRRGQGFLFAAAGTDSQLRGRIPADAR